MIRILAALMLCWAATFSICAERDKTIRNEKDPPMAEGEGGLKLKLAKEFKAALWTANKEVMNPTAIAFDDQNRMYVAETFRFRDGGGLDIREAKFMYFDDIQLKTPEDRRAMYVKYKDKYKPDYFTKNKEKIILLEETKQTGKVDKATLFAEAFNDAIDGPAVGICWHDGQLYYACCPNIWRISGATGSEAKAGKIDVLCDGMCVRVGISGHDVHGTIVGPDGKLYWSIGDRGYNTTSKEGQHFMATQSGAVFRSNLDGTGLELYYAGLRNPQDLAFDDWGNLFTCDNNADIGDASRFTYILEGGTSGWSQGWQMLGYSDFGKVAGLSDRKPDPWLEEGMWKMRFDAQPANILPPAGLLTNGPVGMAFYPGTGFPETYARHFFVCDYTSGENSGVHSCTAEEDGAGFAMKNAEKFLWGLTATDVAFGYDGKLYVSDYGGGWHLPMKGSIVVVTQAEALQNPLVGEVRKLFNDGIEKKDTATLSKLLAHADMRVRQRAQFELVKRGKDGFAALTAAARSDKDLHARVHGIWGLAQLSRTEPDALNTLVWLLHDDSPRIREQAAKMLGDAKYEASVDTLLPLLTDTSARVKTFAAIALGKLHCSSDVSALIDILRENNDKDAFLRHGAIMGLVGAGDASALRAHATDASHGVKLGALLALRKLGDAGVALFLKDSDPQIYAEAVRAIYDTPITAAYAELAAEGERILANPAAFKATSPLIFSRILHANARYAGAGRGAMVARLCAETAVPENVRLFGLLALERWDTPTLVDPILGLPREVEKRGKLVVDDSIRAALKAMLTENGPVSAKAAELALANGIELTDDLLLSYANDTKRGEGLRVISLQQLAARKSPKLAAVLTKLATDGNIAVRVAALEAQITLDPNAGLTAARAILDETGPAADKVEVVIDRTTGDIGNLSMGAPSKSDYADTNSGHGVEFSYVPGFGKPIEKTGVTADGKLPRLNDGIGASREDDVDKNVWIDFNGSRILCDLKKDLEIAAVNTFSWHVSNRAPQQFTLWGSAKEKPNAAAKELKGDWVEIAKVDTSHLNDGGKHGSMIYNPAGSIGKYRWLLWQNTKPKGGTFFSEMDVYEKGAWSHVPMKSRLVQQQVFQLLGRLQQPGATAILNEWLDKLSAGKVPPVLHLDLLEAAELQKDEALNAKVKAYYKGFPDNDKLASFRVALAGGDVKCGEEVFQFHAAGCLKCHKIAEGHGGGDAGPKLGGVGTRLTREKILESVIDPSAVIVPGYGSTTFKLQDGRVLSGSIVSENAKEIVIKDTEGKVTTIAAGDVKKRSQPVSPMPPMGEVLKPRELRNLIEYLSSLK